MNKVAKVIAKRVANAALCTGLLAVGFHMVPMQMDFADPEHGAAHVSAHERAAKRAAAKCGKVKPDTFPTAVIVDTEHGLPNYTTDAHVVDSLFKVAVGEARMPANVKEFKLCR